MSTRPASTPGSLRASRADHGNSFEAALAQIRAVVEDGARHGFFDCLITCEMVNGRKRRLVIKAGKSHQFTVAEDELPGL